MSKKEPSKKELKLELEKYKRILNCMSESVWMGDEQERTIYANPNFCNIMGYTLEEMIGKKSYVFWDEESVRTVQQNNEIRKQGDTSKYEGVLKAKDGTLVPVFLSGTPVPGGGTVGIMTDLREVKSLKKVEDELKELNKTKDEFISIVSHELRTPLTAIKGYLSMVLDEDLGSITELQRKSLTHSYNSANRLIELVNDILCLSKIESGNMTYTLEPKEAIPILTAVQKDLIIDANKRNINLLLNIEPNLEGTKVNVDENKLKQILLNLSTNALKFTREGGSVTLKLNKEDDYLVFSVIDTGEGIPQDKINSLFEKFVQVESALQRHNTSGLGLGLAICKDYIQKFNSKIEVASEVGKGSTFYFKLKIIH